MFEYIKYTLKALLAGAVAFSGSVATGYTDSNMTTAEWWTSITAGLVALGLVFGVKNGPNPNE